jgi:RNA polymerase sigma factor (sigma-70 family)
MDPARLQTVLAHLRRVSGNKPVDRLADQELLEEFTDRQDERAFTELLRRHGPMVHEVCARIVGQESDADDACQATFLLLVQKARSIRKQASVGSWLYGVATRVAWQARDRAERARRLRSRPQTRAVADPAQEAAWSELLAALDAEVVRLPERYRGPVVLCYLEGQTQDEAARQLGWSLRTFRRRLQRGRALLRLRLKRRGLTLSAALLTSGLALHPARALPPLLARATTRAAALLARKVGLSGVVSANVTALVAQVGRGALILTRVKLVLAWALAASVAAAGAGWLAPRLLPPRPAEEVGLAPTRRPVHDLQTPAVRADYDGDALPAGVLRRLGSLRFRQGGEIDDLLPLPDGKTLITSGDPAVTLWDLTTGKVLHRWPDSGEGRPVALTRDGKTLAIGQGNAIQLWDLPADRDIGRFPAGPQEVCGLAFSADGKTLASAQLDQTIRLRDAATGREKARFSLDLPRVSFLALTPDGQTVVAADGRQGDICLLDLATGRPRQRFRREGYAYSFALSPDGRILAAGGHDGTLPLWDTTTGQALPSLRTEQRFVKAVAFSPDGNRLAWSEGDGGGEHAPIRMWDLRLGREVTRFPGHGYWTESLAFAADGRTLFAGVRDGFIGRWDIATRQLLAAPGANRFRVRAVSLSPDGRAVAARTADHLRFWDLTTGQDLGTFPGCQRQQAVAVSPDWQTLAVGERDHTVSLWDISSRRLIGRLVPKQAPDPDVLGWVPADLEVLEVIGAVAFSTDGTRLAVGGWDTAVRIWDWQAGRVLKQIDWPLQRIAEVAFSPDGKLVAALALTPVSAKEADRRVRLWEVATGKELAELSAAMNAPLPHSAADGSRPWVQSAPIFSPDGRLVLRIRAQNTLPVCNANTGKECLHLRGHQAPIITAAFAPDSRTLATASWDNTIRLWDLATGQELGRLVGHRGKANCLAFSKDSKVLVSGGDDTTVLVWSVGNKLASGR